MNAHLFTAATGSKTCTECGKTRNAKAHKDGRLMALAAEAEANVDPATVAPEDSDDFPAFDAEADEARAEAIATADAIKEADEAAIAAAREDMLPGADATTDDSEIADELARLEEQEAAKVEAAKKAPAKKAATKKATSVTDPAPTASIWVGWRITNAAVLEDTTVAAKLKAAKPTGDLDRTVKLTVAELRVLDTVAERFQKEGKTGPEIYSGRALRGRIAAAIAKIESAKEGDNK